MGVTQLGYLGFTAADRAAWERFAEDILGLHVARSGDTTHLRLDGRFHRLLLIDGTHDDLAFTGWEARDADALLWLRKRLTDAGFEPRDLDEDERALRHVLDGFWYTDPAGVRTEMVIGPELAHAREPRTSAVQHGGFKADDLGLGHIVVQTSHAALATAHYVDVLGFRVSDVARLHRGGAEHETRFLRCNRRQHSIAFTLPRGGDSRLLHVMLECEDLDDVGFALDRCRKGDVKIAATLGRHPWPPPERPRRVVLPREPVGL